MRAINEIIIHCSATRAGQYISSATIKKWHLSRGFKDIGYNYIILLDGTIEVGRPIDKMGAHCKGKNRGTIGICYVGGLSKDGKTPMDTRTPEQRKSLELLVSALKIVFPGAITKVSGHNEYSTKACPCFTVNKEF